MERYASESNDRQAAKAIAGAGGTTVSKLGLRFDRVATRVLDRLRCFVDAEVPETVTVILALTAPIRAPGKVVPVLERDIAALLQTGGVGCKGSIALFGNRAELRLIEHAPRQGSRLFGFVHNPNVAAAQVLDLAEHWLLRSGF